MRIALECLQPGAVLARDQRAADGALLVARKDRTRLEALERMRSAITASGVPVVGTVLNRA